MRLTPLSLSFRRRGRAPAWQLLAAAALVVVVVGVIVARRKVPSSSRDLDGARLARAVAGGSRVAIAPENQHDKLGSAARTIETRYKVKVLWKNQEYPVKTYHGPIQATDASVPELDRFFTILTQEFLLYTPDFIRRSQLKLIVLCRGLSFGGQLRTAVPDFEHDALYLDVVRGDHSPIYQRTVIHHDFFHMIDYRDDGQIGPDEQWEGLNPRTFRYGDGGERMQDDSLSGSLATIPGFLTRYATSAVEEDKAELFAHMMTEYDVVAGRAAADRVIEKKIAVLKASLFRFCPDMDERFWSKVGRR